MQSPLVYEASNLQSSYHPMAQMYLTSPPGQASLAHRQDGLGGTQMQQFGSGSADDKGDHRTWHNQNGTGGVMTPGKSPLNLFVATEAPFDAAPSGDIYPQARTEQMSPMQLEMLNRGETIEGHSDVSPLLSKHV